MRCIWECGYRWLYWSIAFEGKKSQFNSSVAFDKKNTLWIDQRIFFACIFFCFRIHLWIFSPNFSKKIIFVPYSPSLGNWCFRNVYSWWCNFVIIFDCIIIKVKTIWRYFHNKSSSFCIFYMHLKLRQVNFDYFLACQIFKIILLYKIISEALHLKLWI